MAGDKIALHTLTTVSGLSRKWLGENFDYYNISVISIIVKFY